MGGIGVQRAADWHPVAPDRPARGLEERTVLEPTSREVSPVERAAVLEKLLFDDIGGAPAPGPAEVEADPSFNVDDEVRNFYGPKLGLDGHCGLRPSVPRPPPFQVNPNSNGDVGEVDGPLAQNPSRFRVAPELVGIILAVCLIAMVLLSRPWG